MDLKLNSWFGYWNRVGIARLVLTLKRIKLELRSTYKIDLNLKLEWNFTFSKSFKKILFQFHFKLLRFHFKKESFHSLSVFFFDFIFFCFSSILLSHFCSSTFPKLSWFSSFFFSLSNFDLIFLSSLHQLQAIIKLQAKLCINYAHGSLAHYFAN